MKSNVYIHNLKSFNKKKERIIKDGVNNLMVLSDFDRTLTYSFARGKKTPSLIAILRENGNYLGEDYTKKAKILAEKYRPIEFNLKINKREKEVLMKEWWSKHLKLLIEKGLNKSHLKQVVDSRKIKFRKKAKEVFDFLNKNNIPLIIISASGLGEEPILMFFEKENKLYSNISVISNSFVWDKGGNAIKYKKDVIHSLNKGKISINHYSFIENKAKERKNIILLGDSPDDIEMANNFDYNNLIKICFLNNETNKDIEQYKKLYDVLILNDSSMEFVNYLLKNFKK